MTIGNGILPNNMNDVESAHDRANSLDQRYPDGGSSGDYEDFIVELPSSEDKTPEPFQRQGDEDIRIPREYQDEYISWTGDIPLPNGRFLYLGRCRPGILSSLLRDERFSQFYVASSWEELFYSEYNHIKYVFEGLLERKGFDGECHSYSGKISEAVPGDEIVEVRPPFIYYGDEEPEIRKDDLLSSGIFPEKPEDYDETTRIEEKYLFIFGDFGIELHGRSHRALPAGLSWFPHSNLPAEEDVLSSLDRSFSDFGGRTITGALSVPKSLYTEYSDRKRKFNAAKKDVRRLRTLLCVLAHARPSLICGASVSQKGEGSKSVRLDTAIPSSCRLWFSGMEPRRSLFKPEVLNEAVDLIFKNREAGGVLRNVRRSLYTLEESRTMDDLALGHVLTWASIESVLLSGQNRALKTNLALGISGLPNTQNRFSTFEQIKESYDLRSAVAHSYKFPDHERLLRLFNYTQRKCDEVIKYAIDKGVNESRGIHELSSELRRNTISY